MSILIKGIEMPDGCRDCKFQNDTICMLIDGCWYDESNGANRRPECPLVPVPPHGRLIDADDIENITVNMNENGTGFNRIMDELMDRAERRLGSIGLNRR